MIGLIDDGITEKKKTLAYFSNNAVFRYRELWKTLDINMWFRTAYKKNDRGR